MHSDATLESDIVTSHRHPPELELVYALAVLWSLDEPERVGEIALIPQESLAVLGRGDREGEVAGGRLRLCRQRPGRNQWMGALSSPRISRDQLVILAPSDADTARLRVENVGKAEMLVNGDKVTLAELTAGDVIELKNRLVLLVTRRPLQMAHTGPEVALPAHPFGEPDAHGIVGETPAAWALRERIAFLAARSAHVLVRGPSGTGKELVAKAIHALSDRGGRPMVSRNAATIPETLIDAELFGNVKDYPNPGMRDRPGLIGEADRSTLFLDEVGELPAEMQAHLLRVLDDGEYQRLGETHTRRSEFRLIGATNRPAVQLKHDFLARLEVGVELPDLNQRREDIPLVARALLRSRASEDTEIARRFFVDQDPANEPRLAPALVGALVRHRYDTHVRELMSLLWQSMATSRGNFLDLTPEVRARLDAPPGAEAEPEGPGVDPGDLDEATVRGALDRAGGVLEVAWKELGLKNRFQLYRLMKRHGLK